MAVVERLDQLKRLVDRRQVYILKNFIIREKGGGGCEELSKCLTDRMSKQCRKIYDKLY